MILNLTLDLPEDGSYIKIARLLSRTLLDYLCVTKQDVQDVEFVIGELCANVTRHSHSTEGRFQITMEYYADRIGISVQDNGGGFSFKDVLPVGSFRPDTDGRERIGGFGLHLVEVMADHLEFRRTEPQGTTVRAEKRLHYETDQDERDAIELDASRGSSAAFDPGNLGEGAA